jgi:hypothetical protein
VFRLLAPAFVVVAVLVPQLALAQVNIDQDKTPAHIFSSDCSVCHKSTRGLANGRGKGALTDYLAEHYTSSRQEAAAVAAYVLAGGGGTGTPAPVHEDNPQPDRARPAAAEEPKTHEASRQPVAEAKPTGSPEERGKPVRPERSVSAEPNAATPEAKPPEGRLPEGKPAPTARLPRGRQKPATVAAVPKPVAAPALAPSTVAPQASPAPSGSGEASPQEASPAEAAPAPTDDIPD